MTIDKVNILIVDDLKENHLVMESVLDDEDINIVKALSGEEALTLCMSHDFSVILMDVQMPGMDGFEAADILRSIEKTKHIPIIFVTAISKEKKSIFRGYEIGAVDYLFKPIDPVILKSKVRIFKEMYLQKRLIERQAEELEYKVKELTQIIEEKHRLESLSMEDPLTKIFNRRGVEKRMSMHWKNCSRYQLPFAIIMMDIDNFKQYNDNYGHVEGDVVLKAVAAAMQKGLFRPEDFIGRIGGEEFLAVLPNTSMDGAQYVAGRIQAAIKDLNISHTYSNSSGRITVSMGIAMTVPNNKIASLTIIDAADQAMYKAKHEGKNCYRIADLI